MKVSVGHGLVAVLIVAQGCAATCARTVDDATGPGAERASTGETGEDQAHALPIGDESPGAHGSGERATDDRPWAVADDGSVALVEPDLEGGLPLMKALSLRRSIRELSDAQLSLRHLSELLWAGFGVNRADGRRTAPSARNRQEMDVYVATAAGLFLYDAQEHRLQRVSESDLRAATGTQDFVGRAPVNLVYVADFSRMEGSSDEERSDTASADAGLIAENVYLYCASEGLATVVRGSVDRESLGRAMSLSPTQHIMLTQTVGYPAE
jgi:SagB-type dehydrogenase family enzyme